MYVNLAQYEQALDVAESACSLFHGLHDKPGEAESFMQMAEAAFALGDYDKSKECYAQSLRLSQETTDQDMQHSVLNSLGNVWMRRGDAQSALACYEQALGLAQRSESEGQEGETLQAIGFVHLQLGAYEKVLGLCEKALVIADKVGNFRSKIFSLTNRSIALYFLGVFDEAAAACRQALTLGETYGSSVECGQMHRQLGRILREMGEYEASREHHGIGLRIFRENSVWHEEAEGLRALTETDLACGEMECALKNLEQAFAIAKKSQSPSLTLRCHSTATAVYVRLGRFVEALGSAGEVLTPSNQNRVGSDVLTKTYFWHFQAALALNKKVEALDSLRKAYELWLVMERKIEDPKLRESVRKVPWRSELLKFAKEFINDEL
jgi:tetratricopeptide (TPR) repeat protein